MKAREREAYLLGGLKALRMHLAEAQEEHEMIRSAIQSIDRMIDRNRQQQNEATP